MNRTTLLLALILTLASVAPVRSQTLRGVVTDAATGAPLESVVISVVCDSVMTGYALTDSRGRYSLSWKCDGIAYVTASCLGYGREERGITGKDTVLNFALHQSSIMLREVEIRPGRIVARKDTVKYNLADFAAENDVYVKDVLKRMPGIDVKDNGQILYNGKPIDHFLVEGMDVSGGRYGQISENLVAKAVKTAELMENYQAIKALNGKISSEQVALNLKLDETARGQWFAGIGAGAGAGVADGLGRDAATLLWDGMANAIRLGSGTQSIYGVKTCSTGNDITREQDMLAAGTVQEYDLAPLVPDDGISEPLDTRRVLFNNAVSANAAGTVKKDDSRMLRFSAGYAGDSRVQGRGKVQKYYTPSDTATLDEQLHYRMKSHMANMEMMYENNSPEHYITDRLSLHGETDRSAYEGVGQRTARSQIKASNSFRYLSSKGCATTEFGSFVQYAASPSEMTLDGKAFDYSQQSLYASHRAGWLHKLNGFTQKYGGGIDVELAEWTLPAGGKDADYNASYLSLLAEPLFQLDRGRMLVSLSLPAELRHYFGAGRSWLLCNPIATLRYRHNYHWTFSAFAGAERSVGTAADLYPNMRRTDYRTLTDTRGLMPVTLSALAGVYAEYKNTVHEFFVTLAASGRHSRNATIDGLLVGDGAVSVLRVPHRHDGTMWSVQANVSKGFYEYGLKTSLAVNAGIVSGEQLYLQQCSGGLEQLFQAYRSVSIVAEPEVSWAPLSWFDASCDAKVGWNGVCAGTDTEFVPLLDAVCRLKLQFRAGNVRFAFSGEHYCNTLDGGSRLDMTLMDAGVTLLLGKWTLDAAVTNIFNRKIYTGTVYAATGSTTSWTVIRPREILFKAVFRL